MLEALQAGSYFVGPAHGATAEVIGDDRSLGSLFTPGSVDSLAEVLLEAITHVRQRDAQVDHSLRLDNDERFSLVNATQVLRAIYHHVRLSP